MKASDFINVLTTRLPKNGEWDKTSGEPYGAYSINLEKDINRALYCVTPTSEIKKYFLEKEYDVLISHHPFVTGLPQMIFHTALDCGVGGLNDQWKDFLQVEEAKHFDQNLGWHGKIKPIQFNDLCDKIENWIGDKIIGEKYSEIDEIKSVVICSGLGGLVNDLALKTKADCYILGESVCSAVASGFKAMIEVGHTLSERMGVNVFKEALKPYNVIVDCAPINLDIFGREVYNGRFKCIKD